MLKLNSQFDRCAAPGSCNPEPPRFFDCRFAAQPFRPSAPFPRRRRIAPTLGPRPTTRAAGVSFRYQTKWSLDYGPKSGEHWTIDQYDPMGEAGGMNLYAAFGNDPVNRYDYLGLSDKTREQEEERQKEEAQQKCMNKQGVWYNGECILVLEPVQVNATPIPNFNHLGGVSFGGGYGNGGSGGDGGGGQGGGGGGNRSGRGSGYPDQDKALQDCLDAA